MHKVVIKGNYYGRTRTLPDLNDYLHECARHPQMGAKMKRDYQMIVCNAIRTQLPRLANKVSVYGDTAVCNLIDECMSNGWKGIIWDKLQSSSAYRNSGDRIGNRVKDVDGW